MRILIILTFLEYGNAKFNATSVLNSHYFHNFYIKGSYIKYFITLEISDDNPIDLKKKHT